MGTGSNICRRSGPQIHDGRAECHSPRRRAERADIGSILKQADKKSSRAGRRAVVGPAGTTNRAAAQAAGICQARGKRATHAAARCTAKADAHARSAAIVVFSAPAQFTAAPVDSPDRSQNADSAAEFPKTF